MPAEHIKNPTGRLKDRWEQDIAPLVGAGVALGAQVAKSVDVDYGTTRPAALTGVDREASARVTAVLVDFHHRSARHERTLRRIGPVMVRHRKSRESTQLALKSASDETAQQVEKLGPDLTEHRQAGRRSLVVGVSLLAMLGLGDVGFAQAVLQLLGLSTLTTWLVASVLGLGQLGALHYVGELVARPGTRDGAGSSRHKDALVAAFLVVPALSLVVFLSWLRAEYLAAQQTLDGGSAGHVSFLVAVAVFAGIQLLLDALAFAIGHRYGVPLVKAVVAARGAQKALEGRERRQARRLVRTEGRFGSALARATGWCETTKAIMEKTCAEERARSAAVYAGIAQSTDPETAAVFCEVQQLTGIDSESLARIVANLAAVEARHLELLALARAYGYPTVDVALAKETETSQSTNPPTENGGAPASPDSSPSQAPAYASRNGKDHQTPNLQRSAK